MGVCLSSLPLERVLDSLELELHVIVEPYIGQTRTELAGAGRAAGCPSAVSATGGPCKQTAGHALETLSMSNRSKPRIPELT